MRQIPLTCAALVLAGFSASAWAQSARATGTVRDTDGRAIQAATIRAVNPDAIPSQIVSTSDDRGRWAMIGLRTGTWEFIVEAPGFVTVKASAGVRVAASPPLAFVLARDPGPIPGALPTNIQAQITAAHMMRDQGRLDQAIAAYGEIRAKNPKFTAINVVLGDTYKARAAQEADPAARRGLLERAASAYADALKADAENARIKAALESTRAAVAAIN
jgi:hypothetical protein